MMANQHDGATTSKQPATVSEQVSSPQLMSRMLLNDNKAGMQGLDKERINQIIYEASKGSKFYENERKKEEALNVKIKEQQKVLDGLSQSVLQDGMKEVDNIVANLEESCDLSHTIVHVDMDAFYAAVEMRDDPKLRNKPMAVGGMGMLSTSNYIARRYGVRAAMPGFIGLKLCPDLILVEPHFKEYNAVSQQVREIFAAYDPNFCPMSLDEAYLDFTSHMQRRICSSGFERTFLLRRINPASIIVDKVTCPTTAALCGCDLNVVLRPLLVNSPQSQVTSDVSEMEELSRELSKNTKICPECLKQMPEFCVKVYGLTIDEAVLEMRNRIEQRTFLTASAGIAPNTMLAKVCSDKNKPNGQYRIEPDKQEVAKFIEDLPIRKISGIGKVTEKMLGGLGVTVCSDLYKKRRILYQLFSPISFHHFMMITLGLGSTVVERDGERKSISTERTFSEISKPDDLYSKCMELSRSLSEDMQENQLVGRTVSLKIKTVTFELKTRSHTLQSDTKECNKIFMAAKQLLKTEIDLIAPHPLRLRLMGVRMSKLSPAKSHQTVASMFQRQTKSSPSPGVSNLNMETWESELGISDDTSQAEFQYFEEEDFTIPFEYGDGNLSKIENSQRCKTATLNLVNREDKHMIYDKPTSNSSSYQNPSTSTTGNINLFDVEATSSNGPTIEPPKKATVSCPVCGKEINNRPLALNSHIDACLLKQTTESAVENDKSAVDFKAFSKKQHMYDEPVKGTAATSSVETSVTESDLVCCPICGQQKRNWQLDLFNSHVDLCLSKKTIKDILQDQDSQLPPSSSRDKTTVNSKKRQSEAVEGPRSKGTKRIKGQTNLLSFFR